MFLHKIHVSGSQRVLAACDKEIRGKVLSEKPRIEVGDFYGDKEIGEEVVELAREMDSVNLMGNRIVGLFISRGIIPPENTIRIGGVLHAIIIRI